MLLQVLDFQRHLRARALNSYRIASTHRAEGTPCAPRWCESSDKMLVNSFAQTRSRGAVVGRIPLYGCPAVYRTQG